ncbi:uncharacterized protein [Phyllobates terribilis]|uniref:uncharacterized protein n=1 Tax=Phyllobates terribilis TaxID=111132 RepID=UPI003CCB360C
MNQSAFGSREIQTYTVAGSWDGRERETVPGGDMSVEDAVKVCLRVRPLNLREQVNLVWKVENNTITQVDGSRSFNFDRVFHSHETTAQVYQEVAVPIIRSALHGYNGTIFAYGQTSSGKTYTMMGAPKNLGIIPQAVGEVFKIIQEIPAREFLLRVSYLEIYNESVTDLLCDDRKKKPLEVREDFNRTVYVADLTEEVVTIPEQVMQWIKKGEKNRHYGETKMNDHSSRSHTIFRMIVESRERNDPESSENCEGAIMVSHLNLVDLAGSERASQTGAEGVRLKEGCNINRSLFILGQVIKKLSDGQVGEFINYRDSKLTRILQNSLGGNTKTVIICTITPISLDETLSTLQFASTAKHVKNTPHVNEVLDDHALLKRYRKEILDLKKQLEELEASTDIKTHAMEEYNQLLSEIKELQKEKEDRICNLGNMMVASTQHEDQRCKKRRRVTWAPGKLQGSLHSAGISHFDIGSKLTANIAKRQKVSEFSAIPEIDDSICTEFSELDDTGRVLDDLAIDADWNSRSHVTYRERTALSYSMIDFSSESTSAPIKDISLQKYKEMEQKVAELENQLKKLTKDSEEGVGKRESLEKEASDVKEVESNTDKDVQTLQLEDTCVRDQTGTPPEDGQQSPVPGDHPEVPQKLTPLKTDDEPELESLPGSPLSAPLDAVCQDPDEEVLSSNVHDMCWEQIRMLEQKIADLEGSACPENNSQNDLVESLQICEALMAEKQSAHNQLGNMQNDFDNLIAENESLKRELADLEKCLQEKHETNEFEMLEKEAQKEHEFASTAKHVKNTPHVNEVLDDHALLKRYRKEILDLKKQLEELEASTDIKTHAMEEYNQLLSEIKELQKEKEDRICNLGNMMVASTQHEDQRCKKRRRVTWAPGKLQGSLHSAGISHFDIGSKLTANIAKRQKVSEFSAIPEIDDSICTEFSELDDTGRVLDDLAIDADWNSGSHVTYRERTALSYSMIDFSSESTSAPIKDISLQKYKEMEQKVAELENQLKKLTKDSEEGVGKRESLEKEASDVKEVESNTDKDVQTLQLEDTCVRDQTGTPPEDGQQSPVPGDHPEVPQKLTPLKTDDEPELESLPGSPLSAPLDAVCQDPDEEVLSSNVHDMCWEQIRMLEQKIADLEGSACPENNSQSDLVESLQICEALMAEKQSAHNQLGNMQNDFDNLIAENESLKRELADLEKCLQEKHETNEFEMLEKEAQKEHEGRIQDLEKQLRAFEADAKQKEQRALLLEDQLRSNVAESKLSEVQVIVKEKEQLLQAAQKEIQMLQGKISKGAAPYKDEIESLKSRVVMLEMDRLKVLKSAEQQISSLKVSVDDKETRLRKLKEELRRTQKDTDTSICSTSSVYPQYPLTCGGGSGIVQSTAMLMLQSQNAALKREIGQYKKKVHQLSRNLHSCEEEVKKLKEPSLKTPTTLLSSLHSHEVVGHEDTDRSRATLVSPPRKSEIPTSHIASLAKSAIHEDNPRLLSKIDVHKPKPMSPNKMERHSAPAMSPDKTRLYGKRPFSPLKTDGPLLSTLIESPHKKPNLPEKVDSPKEKFFDARSKSLPYSPGKFFDNSTLGTLPDLDFSAGTTADSAINDWWDRTGKIDKPNDCKTS